MKNDLLVKIELLLTKRPGLINFEHIPGNGEGEFDTPDKLRFFNQTGREFIEISSKIGSSWYLYGCMGIRFLTIGYKSSKGAEYYQRQTKYIDVTMDDDTLLGWVISEIGKEPDIVFDVDTQNICKKAWKSISSTMTNKMAGIPSYQYGKMKFPRIQYHYDDFDEVFDFEVMDFALPTNSVKERRRSILVQCRLDKNGNRTYWTSTRTLTSTTPPELVELKKEVRVENTADLDGIIKDLFKDHVKNCMVGLPDGLTL